MAPKQTFTTSEVVLAEDKGRYYEAKIMKAKNCSKFTIFYFLS